MPLRRGAGERVGRDERAGDVLGAVDAVGIAGEREDAGQSVERDRERQQELDVAPAAARCPRTVTVVSPPESSTHGGRERLAVQRRLPRDAGHDHGHLARLALDARRRG